VGKIQRRETATEISLLDQERHVTKIRLLPTDQSGVLHVQNAILNYTHNAGRDAPRTGATQLSWLSNILPGKSGWSVENYSSPKRF
jgi:hypothetical protein